MFRLRGPEFASRPERGRRQYSDTPGPGHIKMYQHVRAPAGLPPMRSSTWKIGHDPMDTCELLVHMRWNQSTYLQRYRFTHVTRCEARRRLTRVETLLTKDCAPPHLVSRSAARPSYTSCRPSSTDRLVRTFLLAILTVGASMLTAGQDGKQMSALITVPPRD